MDKSQKAFDSAKANLVKMEHLARSASIALAGAAAGMLATAGTVLASFTKEAIDSADETGRLAQQAGIAVAEFSKLTYSTGLAEVSAETFKTAMKGLSDEMVKSGRGGESLSQQILKVADEFAGLQDGAEKTNRAVQLFGKAGQELIPFLNQGSKAIRDQMLEAEKFGLVISRDFARNADQFNDNLDRMRAAFRGVFLQVADNLLPTLIKTSEALLKIAEDGRLAKTSMEFLTGAFSLANDAMLKVGTTGPQVITGLSEGLKLISPQYRALEFLMGKIIERGREVSNLKPKSGEDTESKSTFIVDEKDLQKALTLQEEWKLAALSGSEALMEQHKLAFEKQVEQINRLKILETDKTTLYFDLWKAHDEKLTALKESGELARADLDAAFRVGDVERFRAMLGTEFGLLQMDLQRRQELMKLNQQAAEALNKSEHDNEIKRMKQMQNLRQNWMRESIQAMDSLAAASAAFGKKGAAAQKIFASASVIMSTSQAVMRCWAEYGWPMGAVFGAVAAAAGAAQLANINKAAGAAHGGLDFVPKEQTYLLDRGERVLSPNQNVELMEFMRRGGQQQQAPIRVSIDGREIFKLFEEASRDGRLQIR